MAQAEADSTILPTPIPTPLNVTALAKKFGVARSTIQRRLKKGWTPPNKVERKVQRRAAPPAAPDAAPAAASVADHNVPHVERHTGRAAGAVLAVTAFAIAGLALTINLQTGWRFGTTPLAAATFAGLSIAADALAIVLPSAAAALWFNRRRALSGAAWATWALAAILATLASAGFASLNISDTAAARAAIVSNAAASTTRRTEAIETARAAAQAATAARQAECKKRGPLCRDLESKQRRLQL